MAFSKNYRLKIQHQGPQKGVTYLTRRDDQLDYFADNQTVLPLSDLLHHASAETAFGLEDAADGDAAVMVLQNVLNQVWANNAEATPQVTVLASASPQPAETDLGDRFPD